MGSQKLGHHVSKIIIHALLVALSIKDVGTTQSAEERCPAHCSIFLMILIC